MNLIKAIRERYQVKLSPAVIADADTLGKLSHELLTRHLERCGTITVVARPQRGPATMKTLTSTLTLMTPRLRRCPRGWKAIRQRRFQRREKVWM